MSVFVKRNFHLEKSLKYKRTWCLWFAAGWAVSYALFFLIAFLCKAPMNVFVIVFFVTFILLIISHIIISSYCDKKFNPDTVQAGLEGEEYAASVLSRLPDSYTVYQDQVVTYEGKESEMDNIVVGPGGVFVIETKNQNGVIYGSYSDRYWEQVKYGKGGNSYSKNMYSPIKQVGTHVYRLAHYLRAQGLRLEVTGMVFMTNREAVLSMKGKAEDILVYKADTEGEKALLSTIKKGGAELTESELKKINAILAK